MAEYIKREAVIDLITRRYENSEICTQEINSIPAADVAPVVHGRWVDGKCSNCGVDIPTDDAYDIIFGHECRFLLLLWSEDGRRCRPCG